MRKFSACKQGIKRKKNVAHEQLAGHAVKTRQWETFSTTGLPSVPYSCPALAEIGLAPSWGCDAWCILRTALLASGKAVL